MHIFEEEARQVVQLLKEGKVILYPTDTIWGIGCLISFPKSVRRIYEIIDRPHSEPMVLIVDSTEMLKTYIQHIHPRIETLMSFHHQPLTVIYPEAKNLDKAIPASNGSIAIRVCSDPFCKMLLSEIQMPLVSISAQLHNHPYPKVFSQIHKKIIDSVDYVVRHRQSDGSESEPSVIISYDVHGELIFFRS